MIASRLRAAYASEGPRIDADYENALTDLLKLSFDFSPRIGKGGVKTPPFPLPPSKRRRAVRNPD